MARTEPFDQYLGEYDKWFAESRCVHESEIEAVRHCDPAGKKGIEIGIGKGRFAVPFHIQEGVEHSGSMRDYSMRLGLNVIEGTAEKLPLEDESDDFALRRVLTPGGSFIVGLVDKDTPLGQICEDMKDQNTFYRYATFYSAQEVKALFKGHDFGNIEVVQTVFGELSEIHALQQFKGGFGEGDFVVIKANTKSSRG